MKNLKQQPARTAIAKALLLTGLATSGLPAWSAEAELNQTGSGSELQWVKPMLEELSAFLPTEAQARQALLAHPKVREARLMASTKQVEADIAQDSPYEWEVGLALRNRRDRTLTSGSGTAMDQELNLSRSFRLPGKQIIKDRQSAKVRLLGDTLYGDSLHEASLSLGQNWLECQRLESRAQLYDALTGELNAFAAQQAKRLQAGEVSRLEAAQAELTLQQLQIEKALNDQQLRSVKSAIRIEFPSLLSALSHRQCGEPAQPASFASTLPMDPPAQEKWVEAMVKLSHPLSIQRIQTEVLQDQSQMNKAERLPDPKVGVSYAMERDNAEQILGVHVSMPLGGSLRRNQDRLVSSELAHAQTVLQTLTQQTRAEAAQSVLNWEQSRRAAVLAENQARFSSTLVKSVEKAYLLGETTATELTLARQQSHRSRMDAIDSTYAALQAQALMLINAHQAWDID